MSAVLLTRNDPARDMARYYRLDVQPDLFGAWFAGERVREFQAFGDAAAKALTKLQAAVILGDLRNPPSNRFEALGGDRKVQYSIRINQKNRVCFKWTPHASVPAGMDAL